MNIFHRIFARLSGDGKSQRSLWGLIIFLLFGLSFFSLRAGTETDAASRQQTSFGTVTQCELRGKGADNYCHYTFPVGDEQYAGVSKTAREVGFGQTVEVYYDSEHPGTNALEDFSQQSRTDRRLEYIFLLALVSIVTFTLWDRAPYPETSNERTP